VNYHNDQQELLELLSEENSEQPVPVIAGRIPYREALELQLLLRTARIENRIPDTLLFLEHHPVITTGIRKDRTQVLIEQQSLQRSGIEVVPISRGGGATAHNPGQLVIYPICKLSTRSLRVAPFVHLLEDIGIELYARYGLSAERKPRFPGLWIGEKKIASLGIEYVKGVTMHGIAANMTNDLSIFSAIVPCGITGVEMTSLKKETGRDPDMEEVKSAAADIAVQMLCDHPVKRLS
jgi:lipoate-protein ligase B